MRRNDHHEDKRRTGGIWSGKEETVHTYVMKGLMLCKSDRPDIPPAIAFLSTRVHEPNENDWSKLIDTADEFLILEADSS